MFRFTRKKDVKALTDLLKDINLMTNIADNVIALQAAVATLQAEVTAIQTSIAAIRAPAAIDLTPVESKLDALSALVTSLLDPTPAAPATETPAA